MNKKMAILDKISTRPPENLGKPETKRELLTLQKRLFDLQNVLYAEAKHSLLIILQGMDASGKDGVVKNVFSCVNPMGCNVTAFKAPTEIEKAHDYMWRIYPNLPAKGMIRIFNRSYYEDILVPTVMGTHDPKVIDHRYGHINTFEQRLQANGTKVMKFFLHLSKEEQSNRIAERLTKPHKRWKYSKEDKKASKKWDAYKAVYENILTKCSPEIPWTIIPADVKWYRNFCIAKEVVRHLESLDMKYPQPKL